MENIFTHIMFVLSEQCLTFQTLLDLTVIYRFVFFFLVWKYTYLFICWKEY